MSLSKSRALPLLLLTVISSIPLTSRVSGQRPRLLKDINTTRLGRLSSDPAFFTDVGGRTVFIATTVRHGTELFASDGTAPGTRVLADRPGSSYPAYLTALGKVALLSYYTGSDRELWITDGTDTGTHSLVPSSKFKTPMHLVRFGNRILFSAIVAGMGTELCISDGTTAGTRLLKDIVPGPGSSAPQGTVVVGNTVYFLANSTRTSIELWRTDGTAAGTLRVNVIKAKVDGAIVQTVAMGNRVVVAIGLQIFTSNGTAAGTISIADGQIVGVTKNYFCYATFAGIDLVLWSSDGSSRASVKLATLIRGAQQVKLNQSIVTASVLLFPWGPAGQRDLFRTDGTVPGTYRITPANGSGLLPLFPSGATFKGRTYFIAGAGSPTGVELWTTDGTAGGTRPFHDVYIGPDNFYPASFAVIGSRLWFSANTIAGREPWLTDGTVGGTRMVADLNARATWSTASSMYSYDAFASAYGSTYFMSSRPFGLWKTDGTAAGTSQVSPAVQGSWLGIKSALGRLFFSANDRQHGHELWSSDGTAAGTGILKDINPGPASGLYSGPGGTSVAGLAEYDGGLLFSGLDQLGAELWRTDGTTAGTVMVKDILPGTSGSRPTGFFAHGGKMIFFTEPRSASGSSKPEMWKTDGTTAGTVKVAVNLNGQRYVNGPVAYGKGRFLFITWSSFIYYVWASDGTAAGTRQVATITGPGSSLEILGGTSKGCFVAHTNYQGAKLALWFWDAAAGKMILLQSGVQTTPWRGTIDGALLRDHLIYEFESPGRGVELFTSDGSVAGTRLLADLNPGQPSSKPHSFARVGSRFLYFIAGETAEDLRVWRTDGTANGTYKMPGNARPFGKMLANDGQLFYAADDPQVGAEPFALDLDAMTVAVGRGCGERSTATLNAQDPVIGLTDYLHLDGAMPARIGIMVFGAKPRDLRSVILLGSGCVVALDFRLPTFSLPIKTDPAGAATLTLRIPADLSLIGADIMAQAAVGSTRGPYGFDLSAALHLTLGY